MRNHTKKTTNHNTNQMSIEEAEARLFAARMEEEEALAARAEEEEKRFQKALAELKAQKAVKSPKFVKATKNGTRKTMDPKRVKRDLMSAAETLAGVFDDLEAFIKADPEAREMLILMWEGVSEGVKGLKALLYETAVPASGPPSDQTGAPARNHAPDDATAKAIETAKEVSSVNPNYVQWVCTKRNGKKEVAWDGIVVGERRMAVTHTARGFEIFVRNYGHVGFAPTRAQAQEEATITLTEVPTIMRDLFEAMRHLPTPTEVAKVLEFEGRTTAAN